MIYLRPTWFGSWETKFKSWVNPSLVLPQWIVCTYLFFIKIMIKPSIVLMIRQITIMWKFSFRNSLAWFLRFSLNTSLIWTMYFWILELVIARTKSEILTIHWGKLPNTNLRFCILVKIICNFSLHNYIRNYNILSSCFPISNKQTRALLWPRSTRILTSFRLPKGVR